MIMIVKFIPKLSIFFGGLINGRLTIKLYLRLLYFIPTIRIIVINGKINICAYGLKKICYLPVSVTVRPLKVFILGNKRLLYYLKNITKVFSIWL